MISKYEWHDYAGYLQSVQIFGVFCWSGKATIKVGNEGIQPDIRIFNIVDTFETHFLDKPILECLVCTLDPAFSLRAVGTYQLDTQFSENSAKLRSSGRGGTAIIDPENTVYIAVKRKWFAVPLEILTCGHHIVEGRLRFTKPEMHQPAGGVVNENQQAILVRVLQTSRGESHRSEQVPRNNHAGIGVDEHGVFVGNMEPRGHRQSSIF